MRKPLGWLVAGLMLCLGAAALAQVTITASCNANSAAYRTCTWETLTENATGNYVNAGTWAGIKTVTIVVANQAGESVTIQGSNDGTNWFTLHSITLDTGVYLAITGITSDAIYTIIEDPLYVRPLMTNVSGSGADFDVTLGARR